MREIRESVTESGYDSVCLSVVSAVARAVDTDPLRLEPLATVVDPDALERLVAGGDDGDESEGRADGGAVSFTMAGCRVVVDAGGDIAVTCPDESDGDGMAEPRNPDRRGTKPRYEFTEFTDELGTVAVMYDAENPDAWIQSTSPARVEQ